MMNIQIQTAEIQRTIDEKINIDTLKNCCQIIALILLLFKNIP